MIYINIGYLYVFFPIENLLNYISKYNLFTSSKSMTRTETRDRLSKMERQGTYTPFPLYNIPFTSKKDQKDLGKILRKNKI
jgi:hypothetical protein